MKGHFLVKSGTIFLGGGPQFRLLLDTSDLASVQESIPAEEILGERVAVIGDIGSATKSKSARPDFKIYVHTTFRFFPFLWFVVDPCFEP